MLKKDPGVLAHSKNPRELVSMARLYAVSREPADQDVLYRHLDSKEFLGRLNTDEEYLRFGARNLDVARVIKTLMEQDAPEPRETLVRLTESSGFQTYEPLIELLIRGLVADIPACPRTIAYWDKHSQPDSAYTDIVVEVLFINRSRPALDLFERKMNDPGHDDEYKEAWLRDPLLRKRNDTDVLQCCERMVIGGTVEAYLHESIFSALFDYSEEWYLSCSFPRPELRILAPDASKDILETLGKHALAGPELESPGLADKIRMALKEIGRDDENDAGDDQDDEANA